MPSRVLPNLGLKAFFIPGEDGWGDDVSQNFLKLSVLVQAGAINVTTTLPTAPAQGDVYIIGAGALSNPNAVAVYDSTWKYYTPSEGWTIFNQTTNSYMIFDGTNWRVVALDRLLDLTARDVGATSGTSVIDRATGDARYALSAASVSSFNGRAGTVVLTQEDILAAGFDGAVTKFNGRSGEIAFIGSDLSTLSITDLGDVPSYVGKKGMTLRVNNSETSLDFTPSTIVFNVAVDLTVNTDHIDGFLSVDAETACNISVPVSTTIDFPVGTRITIARIGSGPVNVIGFPGVTLSSRLGYSTNISLQGGVATLVYCGSDLWSLYGDLALSIDAASIAFSVDGDELSVDNGA